MLMCPDCYFAAYPTGDNGNGCFVKPPLKHLKPKSTGISCDGIETLGLGRVLVSDLPDDQPLMTDVGRGADDGKACLEHWQKAGVSANGSQCACSHYGALAQAKQKNAERRAKKRKLQTEASAEVNLACGYPDPYKPAPLCVATTGECALGPCTGKSANVHSRPLLGAMIQGFSRLSPGHIRDTH